MKSIRFAQLALLAAIVATAQSPKDDAEVQLRAAIEKETVSGDLKAAIQLYEKIARGGNRSAAAKALVRMGQCYEKLGDAEASKAYERAVRDFADQKDSATMARTRLAVLAGPRDAVQGVRTRLVWDGSPRFVMNVSADGRWAPYLVDETSGLGIRNLVTGEQRVLKNGRLNREGLDECLVSPDGKQVVFLWWQASAKEGAGEGYSLRMIRTDGTAERVLWDISGSSISYLMPRAWSADGKLVAVRESRGDTQKIVIVELETGKRREIPMPPQTWPERLAFSPDARWLAVSGYAVAPQGRNVYTLDVAAQTPTLRIIAESALLMGVIPNGRGVLYTRARNDKSELWLAPLKDGQSAGAARHLSAVANLEGEPLGISPAGTLFYETRTTSADAMMTEFDATSMTIGKTIYSRPAAWIGPGMQSGSIKFSRDGRKVVITMPNGALLIRSLEDGSEHTIVPQMEAFWHVEWSADGQWLYANGNGKPPEGKNGLHRFDPNTGAVKLILASGGEFRPFGQFAPSPDGKQIYWPGGPNRSLAALDLTALTARIVEKGTKWPLMAVPRLSPDGTQAALFSENRVKIVDLASGNNRILYQKTGNFFGGDWSPDGRYLYTTFGVSDRTTELIRIPLDGSQPLVKPLTEQFRSLRLSPDGKRVAVTRWNQHRQVWALENFLPAN